MQNPFSSHHQQPFALTPVFTKDTLLPDSRSVRTTLRTVERLAQMARAKANGANVHSVNHTIGALRCWCYMRLHVKSRAARQAATADAIACALKLRAFIVTGQITL